MFANAGNNIGMIDYRIRANLLKSIRKFFDEQGYLEVETPVLVTCPGTELYLEPFFTDCIAGDKRQMALRTSPELGIKKLMSTDQSMTRVFEIAKCFRNGKDFTPWHHPEFTMLEWYQVGISIDDFMDQTETLIRSIVDDPTMQSVVCNDAKELLQTPIERVSLPELFLSLTGLDIVEPQKNPPVAELAKKYSSITPKDDFQTIFYKLLIDVIEPNVASRGVCFLYDFPASEAALARVEHGVAKRFELYWQGVELCNAFWELTDSIESEKRFNETNRRRKELGYPLLQSDPWFQKAMSQGLPEMCGNALGVERLLACLMGKMNLDALVPFRNEWEAEWTS